MRITPHRAFFSLIGGLFVLGDYYAWQFFTNTVSFNNSNGFKAILGIVSPIVTFFAICITIIGLLFTNKWRFWKP